ncbi:hypothetical protein ZWY2020_054949 [Hordeum vulgare]|nr:hypothetical protein ZWY2020_054949 [Hordeum vulgare]
MGPDGSPSASGGRSPGGRKPAQTSSESAVTRKVGETTSVARICEGQRRRDELLQHARDLAGHPHRFLRPSVGRSLLGLADVFWMVQESSSKEESAKDVQLVWLSG